MPIISEKPVDLVISWRTYFLISWKKLKRFSLKRKFLIINFRLYWLKLFYFVRLFNLNIFLFFNFNIFLFFMDCNHNFLNRIFFWNYLLYYLFLRYFLWLFLMLYLSLFLRRASLNFLYLRLFLHYWCRWSWFCY